MNVPKIFTYECRDGDVPPERAWAAAMDGAAPGRHWIATGPTPEAARGSLEAFWVKCEQERPPPKPRKKRTDDEIEAEEGEEAERAYAAADHDDSEIEEAI